jgi:hypothetical protein
MAGSTRRREPPAAPEPDKPDLGLCAPGDVVAEADDGFPEHISFEDVIREADVSRSSAYRRWPHKDLF